MTFAIHRGAAWPAFAVALTSVLAMADVAVAQKAQPPVPVFAAEARREAVVDKLEALGTLRANEQVTITAQVTEVVAKINFTDGERVKQGHVLVEMTSAEERAMLKEADATAREAKEQLERAEPLARRGVSSDSVLSERRRDAETAAARFEMMNSRLADRRVVAPFDGILGLRRISVGALLEPGTVITTIDDDSRMKLDFTVPATVLARLAVGQRIEARSNAYGERRFEGRIAAMDSRIDPVTRSISVRAILPNPDRLLRGGLLMMVDVLQDERQALVVPEKAIVPRGRLSFVYVVDVKADKPKAIEREVVLGSRYPGKVEIASGLKAGEHVITDGTLRVSPGQAVEVKAIEAGDEPLVRLLEQGRRNPS